MSRNVPRRRRAWTMAVLASAGLHLAALLALGTIMGRRAGAWGGSGRVERVMAVAIMRLPKGWSSPQPQTRSSPLTAVKHAPEPEPQPVAESEAVIASPTAGSPGDIDALFRAPFRTAVGQAYASLRGGLGCAHVALSSLPDDVRALCDTAARLKAAQQDIRRG